MTTELNLAGDLPASLPALNDLDAADMLAVAERADLALLGLVSCVALATLVLGAATSLLA